MTVEKEDKDQTPSETEAQAQNEPAVQEADPKPKSAREAILAAIREQKSKAEKVEREKPQTEQGDASQAKEEKSSKAKTEAEESGQPETPAKADKPRDADDGGSKKVDAAKDGAQEEKSQDLQPPTAWSKSAKAQWSGLPLSIQEEILRRETNSQDGVEKLKARHEAELQAARLKHSDIDQAVAPYKEAIRQSGRSEREVVARLFDWHMALAGPNKNEAFKALAHNFNVDIATLAGGASAAQGGSEGSEGTQSASVVPDLSWVPAMEGMARRIEQFEAMTAANQQAAAQRTVEEWSRNKPHFERVRQRMAHLINMDANLLQQGQPALNGFIRDGQVDMDAAYEAARWADPELRVEMLREQQEANDVAAREAAERVRLEAEKALRMERAKLEAEKAKKAATSLKTGAPLSGLNSQASKQPTRESVRDSIRRAMQGA